MKQDRLVQLSMDYALEMILVFTGTGRISYANPAARKMLDYGVELLTCSITDIFPGVFTLDGMRLEWQISQNEELQSVMAYRKNRTCFAACVKFVEIPEEQGVYLCFGYDDSANQLLKRQAASSEKEMESANKVKTEFVANVTHELRTPVNGILGNTKELLDIEMDGDKRARLQLVMRGCDDMHAIINSILDFSKLDAGKLTLEHREFEFRPMMEYVKANHKPKITEKGLDFFVTISPEVPTHIVGDELRIVQILNNLLSNATKFTSVGKISLEVIKTAQVGNRAELFFIVMDTGIGIKKESQDKLFQSFTQVDASVTREYGGTGLGLNISKQLVGLMNGSINLQSEYGKGSIFSFNIWVEMPQADAIQGEGKVDSYVIGASSGPVLEDQGVIWTYGTTENREETEKKLTKLGLSVDMENWEKAEMFAETVKQLTKDAPQEIRSLTLRLKMAVQKADVEKFHMNYEKLQEALKQD